MYLLVDRPRRSKLLNSVSVITVRLSVSLVRQISLMASSSRMSCSENRGAFLFQLIFLAPFPGPPSKVRSLDISWGLIYRHAD